LIYFIFIKSVPTITEQEAREALIEFVADHCCYGNGAAQDLNFNDLQSSSAFHVSFWVHKAIYFTKIV